MIYQIIHSVLSTVGVSLNAFMMYLALTKSPKIMRPCSAIITIKTGTDILASIMSFFVMQRVITDGSSIIVIPTGPCTNFGKTACYVGHMLMLCFLEYNLIWMISSYIFRYYILYVRDPPIKHLVFVAFCLSIPSMVHMAAWFSFYDSNETTEDLSSYGIGSGEMALGGEVVYWSAITLITQLFITAFLVVVAYIWIRETLCSFAVKMGSVKKDVKNLNKRLVKVINFQVFLPSFIFLGVITFASMFTSKISYEYAQYAISVIFMFSPICSPFSYILFVPHYRNVIIGKKKQPKPHPEMCGPIRSNTRTTSISVTNNSSHLSSAH
ncbi:Serpentine receptor class delta-30 [Caenorhabditis elegans]|uniref:Serpentine receptor class delta-30 n=1 Tax=Caenorhabditis elegans TaxID=6239 RepID=SRD30_CAEEL|nr:Serpentine receptor class delta-30 [Caenorhabditis elegans]P91209.1 RecName: Full=Serpentine receptor class delta-30; Short=Protein srd-30 [Caenorhabditis elegans]CCD64294.1 Serpentine receptor class delta-30 [Caenorhabditis elegans]|eukprot:NP_504972.1 Serpentine receptor class delta-30 [Caenorhabditis elegans]